jgi:hypothetical protein
MANEELPNPFRSGARGRPAPEGMRPKDWARLGVLVLFFGFVVLAMAMLHRKIKEGFDNAAKRKPEGIKIRGDAAPKDDNLRLAELLKLAQPFADDPSPTDISLPYFLAILDFVSEREIGDLVDPGLTIQQLRQSPEKLRGRVVRLKGTLLSSKKHALQKPSPRQAWALAEMTVDIEGVGPVTVFSPQMPDVQGDKPPVQFTAAFLRLVTAEGGPAMPVFFSKGVLSAATPVIPPPDPDKPGTAPPPRTMAQSLDPDAIKRVASEFRDGTDPLVKETQPFLTLMGMLHDAEPRAVSKLATSTTTDLLLVHPDQHRGEVVRIYGQLAMMLTERLEATTPQGIDRIHFGTMASYPKATDIHLYISKWPDDVRLTEHSQKYGYRYYRDWIEVEGVFLRTYAYEGTSTDGGPGVKRNAAIILVRSIRLAEGPKMADPRGGFTIIVFSIALFLVIMVITVGIWSRRFKKEGTSLRMALTQERIKRTGKLLPPPDPSRQVLGDEVPKPAEPAAATIPPAPEPPPAAPPAPPA